MVVFTCNACSAILKRNQVDKHCYQCRRCESLSCVDCGKDFWGDDYQQHTKCITEEEKYGGKDKAPKVFKGEAKQEQWVEQVQTAIQKASSKPKLRGLLERLIGYPNIPRKKAKFENFVRNSLRVNHPTLITEVWDILMTENSRAQGNKTNDADNSTTPKESELVSNSNDNGNKDHFDDGEADVGTTDTISAKSKRERKEERRKKSQKKEKKDKVLESTENITSKESQKKSKKRKRNESEDLDDQKIENGDKIEEDRLKKKKRKNKEDPLEDSLQAKDDNNSRMDECRLPEEQEDCLPPAKRKKTKFDWEIVIKSLLEKKGEMSLKKLKKKVLNEFAAQDAANYSEENLSARFDKKILKIVGVKVHKDRANLIT